MRTTQRTLNSRIDLLNYLVDGAPSNHYFLFEHSGKYQIRKQLDEGSVDVTDLMPGAKLDLYMDGLFTGIAIMKGIGS